MSGCPARQAALVAWVLVGVLVAGCGGTGVHDSSTSAASVTVKGSDTMVHLVTGWAEAFAKERPDLQVAVTGGGSGTGIAALINGTTDVCAASREMKPDERARASQKGHEAAEHAVARDGIAVVVNAGNPIDTLNLEQLKKIYTGAVTNWNQLGGPDQRIQVVSRESSSGTYAFFQEHVLANEDYVATAQLLPATSAIVQAVSSEPWSIGYVGLGYTEGAPGLKVLGITRDGTAPVVKPTPETVLSGEYSISRALYLYTAAQPTPAAQAFLDFCLGAEGQRIVREQGYVPVK